MKKILVTGGAGFVGSNLALAFKRDNPGTQVFALDNLKRRGSELTLPRLKAGGVEFIHGDIRNPEDLAAVGAVDLLLECSAEPSVHAGYGQSPAYLVNTNLIGLINCLEYLRQFGGDLVFLSTSRVYPIAPLRALPLKESPTRLVIGEEKGLGWSKAGISEEFPLAGARSLYGATKLCAEYLIEEYRGMYGIRSLVLRSGVLTGPWQMGKVDQGFIVLWLSRHLYGGKLSYMGFGGKGLQVRDLLNVKDLYRLLEIMLPRIEEFSGQVFNIGGGAKVSVSLQELTQKAQALSGKEIEIVCDPLTRDADIPYYVTDNSQITAKTGWAPEAGVDQTLGEIWAWLQENQEALRPVLG